MSNILFKNFPRCFILFDMKDLNNQKVNINYNPITRVGEIAIFYSYKGLYVIFHAKLNKLKNYHAVYTRLSGFECMTQVENSTVLDENIPSFKPILSITRTYNLRTMMLSAYKYKNRKLKFIL